MATVTEKLRFLLEADASGAVRGFKQVGTEVGVAETRMGKFKAALPQVTSQLSAVAGVGAVVGGAMLKAADQFKNLALEAGHMADATGLSVEQSSRWVEVLGDLGVESSTLETALGRLNKTISTSPQALADLGVAVVRLRDGSVDVQGTFLALIDRLNAIPDPAKRAEVATKALGRGWQELATVIGTGSGSLKDALEGVDAAKVITPEERKRAEEYRDAMNDLKDKFEELSITVGEELVPALTEMAGSLADGAQDAKPFLGALDQLVEKTGFLRQNLAKIGPAFLITSFGIKGAKGAWNWLFGDDDPGPEKFFADLDTAGSLIKGLGEEQTTQQRAANAEGERWNLIVEKMTQQALDEAFHDAAEAAGDLAEAEGRARDALRDYNREWDELTDEIDDNDAIIGLIQGFDAIKQAHEDTAKAGKKGAQEQKDAFLREGETINETKRKVIEYGREILGLPAEQVTQLVAMVDDGELDALLRKLQILTRNKNISLDIVAKGGVGYFDGPYGASGGIVTRPTVAMIGEAGPEAVVPLNRAPGASPLPVGMGGAAPITINVSAGISSPRETARAIAEVLEKYGYR